MPKRRSRKPPLDVARLRGGEAPLPIRAAARDVLQSLPLVACVLRVHIGEPVRGRIARRSRFIPHTYTGAPARGSPLPPKLEYPFYVAENLHGSRATARFLFFLDGWRRQVVARGRATSGGGRWLRKFVISPFAAFFP